MTDESATYEKETSRNSMAHFVATISFASGLSCRTLAMVRRQVTGILTTMHSASSISAYKVCSIHSCAGKHDVRIEKILQDEAAGPCRA